MHQMKTLGFFKKQLLISENSKEPPSGGFFIEPKSKNILIILKNISVNVKPFNDYWLIFK
jgi:hypothetical protein